MVRDHPDFRLDSGAFEIGNADEPWPTATLPSGISDAEGGIVASQDSLWILTKPNSTLARVDPQSKLDA